MPSPLGHALAGIAAGWLLDPPRAGAGGRLAFSLRHAVILGFAGMAPDLDLLVGAHSGPTHGLGAAVLAGSLALMLARPGAGQSRRVLFACAVALAYSSHTLLDWLGHDTTPPIGIMALWPFSREYFESPLHIFEAITRRYWLPGFWRHNLPAMARELAIIAPVLLAVFVLRRRKLPADA
jgi:inner membrane protein